jgi:hypothetical protein
MRTRRSKFDETAGPGAFCVVLVLEVEVEDMERMKRSRDVQETHVFVRIYYKTFALLRKSQENIGFPL